METLSEFLKHEENQEIVLNRIIESLRDKGEWGSRGLYAKIGKETELSPAYVGRILTGKQMLSDTFMVRIAKYLGVDQDYLRAEVTGFVEMHIKFSQDQLKRIKKAMAKRGYTTFTINDIALYMSSVLIKETQNSMQQDVEAGEIAISEPPKVSGPSIKNKKPE